MFVYTQKDSSILDRQTAMLKSPVFGKDEEFCFKFKFFDSVIGDGNTSLTVEVNPLGSSGNGAEIWRLNMKNTGQWQQASAPVPRVNETFQLTIRVEWSIGQVGSISVDEVVIGAINSSCSSK